MRSTRVLAYWLGLAAVVLLPQFYQVEKGAKWGFATVVSGDEPHYLVLLNSVILDGDFDVRNNYLSVHEGSNQAGARFAGSGLDHQITYWMGGRRVEWSEVFNVDVGQWPKDSRGHLVPQVKPGVDPRFAVLPEAAAHPVGVAVLLAPIAFPFRGTRWVEHVAIFCSALATLLAAYFYQRILRYFSKSDAAVWVTTLAVFLATPLLFYTRSFFNEPFVTLCVIAAFALALAPGKAFWAGLSVAVAMLMKPPSVVLLAPLSLLFLPRRDLKSLLLLGIAPLAAALLTLWWNDRLYGSPWLGPYPFYRGNLWQGAWGLLTSERHGLLWFAPVLVLSALGWPGLVRRFPLEALACLLGFALLYLITAWWAYWVGGWCYGPRLIVPALPLLGLGLVHALERSTVVWIRARWLIYGAMLYGTVVNFLAVIHSVKSWNNTPIEILRRNFNI